MSDIRKLAGTAGIVFVVLVVICFLLPGEPPMIDDPNSDILEYLSDKRGVILFAQWLTWLTLVPALIFFGYFLTRLRSIEGDPAARTMGALVALAGVAVFAALVAVIFAAGAFEADHGLSEDNARLLWDLGSFATNAQLATFGAWGLLTGWIIVSKSGLPAWTGWLGIASGVAGFAGAACMASDGAFALTSPLAIFPAILLFLVYSLAVSVVFLREK